MKTTTGTVEVKQVSDLATERQVHEFFSFSGEIEHIDIFRENERAGTAFVTFKDTKALEIALLLSNPLLMRGATVVDQTVIITRDVNCGVRMVEDAMSIAPVETIPYHQ